MLCPIGHLGCLGVNNFKVASWTALQLVEDVKAFRLVKTNKKSMMCFTMKGASRSFSYEYFNVTYLVNSNVTNTNVKATLNMINSVTNSCPKHVSQIHVLCMLRPIGHLGCLCVNNFKGDSWTALKLVEDVKAFRLVKTNKKSMMCFTIKGASWSFFYEYFNATYLVNSSVMNTNVKATLNMIYSATNSCPILNMNQTSFALLMGQAH